MSMSYFIEVGHAPIERGDLIKIIIRLIEAKLPSASKYFIVALRFSSFSALYTANGMYMGQIVNAKTRNIYPKTRLIWLGLSLSH